jgi:hypothetical protein
MCIVEVDSEREFMVRIHWVISKTEELQST